MICDKNLGSNTNLINKIFFPPTENDLKVSLQYLDFSQAVKYLAKLEKLHLVPFC